MKLLQHPALAYLILVRSITLQMDFALLCMGSLGSVIFVGYVFLSRRYIFAGWAKVVSVIACLTALGWGVLGFMLLHSRDYQLTRYTHNKLVGIKGTLAGLAIAFLLSVLIARPCQKVANTQT